MRKLCNLNKLGALPPLLCVLISTGCGRAKFERVYESAHARVDDFEAAPGVICPGDNVTIRFASTALETSVTAAPETAPELSMSLYGVVRSREEVRPVENTTRFRIVVRTGRLTDHRDKTVQVIRPGDNLYRIVMTPACIGGEPHWQMLREPGVFGERLRIATVENLTGRAITLTHAIGSETFSK